MNLLMNARTRVTRFSVHLFESLSPVLLARRRRNNPHHMLTTASDIVGDIWKLIFHLLSTRICGRFLLADKHIGKLARRLVPHFFITDPPCAGFGESPIVNHTLRASIDGVYLAKCFGTFTGIERLELPVTLGNANVMFKIAIVGLLHLKSLSCSSHLLINIVAHPEPIILDNLRVLEIYDANYWSRTDDLLSSHHFPCLETLRTPSYAFSSRPQNSMLNSEYILSRCPTIKNLIGARINKVRHLVQTYPHLRSITCDTTIRADDLIKIVAATFPTNVHLVLQYVHVNTDEEVFQLSSIAHLFRIETLNVFARHKDSDHLCRIIRSARVTHLTLGEISPDVFFIDAAPTSETTFAPTVATTLSTIQSMTLHDVTRFHNVTLPSLVTLELCDFGTIIPHTLSVSTLRTFGIRQVRATVCLTYYLQMLPTVYEMDQLCKVTLPSAEHLGDIIRVRSLPHLRSLTFVIRPSVSTPRAILLALLGFPCLETLVTSPVWHTDSYGLAPGSQAGDITYAYALHPNMSATYPMVFGDTQMWPPWFYKQFKESPTTETGQVQYINDLLASAPYPRPPLQPYLLMQEEHLPILLSTV